MRSFSTINFKNWIEENRHLLKPPVGNKCVWPQGEFIVMVVGGPNERTDFHVNTGEEFFYQLEGDMVLKVFNEGKIEDVNIREGDIFLLPANVPHSPQRGEHTIGLVIERQRGDGQLDGLQWYCENCGHKLYEEFFQLEDIETQFDAVFDRYYDSDYTTCGECGTQNGRKWNHAEN